MRCARTVERIEKCWVGWVQGTCITWGCRCPHPHGKRHFWDGWL